MLPSWLLKLKTLIFSSCHSAQQHLQQRGAEHSMDRVNSADKTECLYALSLSVCSVASKYPDNLAWYFGSSPLSVDVSWVEERKGLSEGEGERSGQAEKERRGGGVSGLFKALVLCLKEGEAHMHWEKPTCTHIVVAAAFSQPAHQTDSSKRSLEPTQQREEHRGLETRKLFTEDWKE